MTNDELAARLAEIVEDHKSDKDGGYYLVAAISDLYLRLSETDQAQLREYVLEKVEREDPKLWGVGLEFLTRHGDQKIAQRLEELARSAQTLTFKQQLIRALLRMGHEALDLYLPHIQLLIAQDQPACAELAHLYQVSPDSSLTMSASFFARELSVADGVRRTENCIPVFVYNYPKDDESSLAKLVTETGKINPNAGAALRRIILDYLDKPWIVNDLGSEKRNRVFAALRADDT
jgi:hypothetical protein